MTIVSLMTTLSSILANDMLPERQCKTLEECLRIVDIEPNANTFVRNEIRIPIPHTEPSEDIKVCKSSCGRSYLQIKLISTAASHYASMLSDFVCNVDYSILLGRKEYDIKRSLPLCSYYNPSYAIIYLDQPNLPSEILFSQKQHYFSYTMRRYMLNEMNRVGVIDGEIKYNIGMAFDIGVRELTHN